MADARSRSTYMEISTGFYGEQGAGWWFCHMGTDHLKLWNDYSICRLFISHRIATSLLSKSRFDDDDETRY